MQEIIFRGKSIAHHGKKEEWVYGFYSNFKGVNGRTHYISDDNGRSVAVRPETIGQFTGLIDAYGTRIFEGDIISSETVKHKIVWNNEWAKFQAISGSVYASSLNQEWIDMHGKEVVGNIYDNPEIKY